MIFADVVHTINEYSLTIPLHTYVCIHVMQSKFAVPISLVYQYELLTESTQQKYIIRQIASTKTIHKKKISHNTSQQQQNVLHQNTLSKKNQPHFYFPPTNQHDSHKDCLEEQIHFKQNKINTYDTKQNDTKQNDKKEHYEHTNQYTHIHEDEKIAPVTNNNTQNSILSSNDEHTDNTTQEDNSIQENNKINTVYAIHDDFDRINSDCEDVVEKENKGYEEVREDMDDESGHKDIQCIKPRVPISVPLVSIIMTTFNCGKYIEFAVRSLQLQTLTNWELIIINDKSTDHSDSLIRTLAQNDDRIVYLHNIHNIGCYASKNIALQYVRGTWLTFHDADDYSMSERLEKQLHICLHGQEDHNTDSPPHHSSLQYECCYVTSLSRKDKVWSWVPITMFILTNCFRVQLGAFDTTRFGADSEIRNRMDILKLRIGVVKDYLYACPDRWIETNSRQGSLTGNQKHDPIRLKYKHAFLHYHNYVKQTQIMQHMHYTIPTPDSTRPFAVNGLNEEESSLLYPSYQDIKDCLVFNEQGES